MLVLFVPFWPSFFSEFLSSVFFCFPGQLISHQPFSIKTMIGFGENHDGNLGTDESGSLAHIGSGKGHLMSAIDNLATPLIASIGQVQSFVCTSRSVCAISANDFFVRCWG